MPVILAIEPDQQQAAQLTSLVRQRVQAELVVADTIEAGLEAIGHRVPDIVLVPRLSPHSDAALASALRVITAAAHIRTLTIPVLSGGEIPAVPPETVAVGTDTMASEACGPAAFAERITSCLNDVAAECAAQDDPGETVIAMSLTAGQMWPMLEGVEAESRLPAHDAPTVPEFDSRVAGPRHLEWNELVASLRQDLERRRGDAGPARQTPADTSGAAAVPRPEPDNGPQPPSKSKRPAQDEWGFFDPAQCGFAALLAKLEEIAAGAHPADDPDARSRA